jgi:hypothetical protein
MTSVGDGSPYGEAGPVRRHIAPVLGWLGGIALFAIAVAIATMTVIVNLEGDLTAPGGSLWDFRDASFYSVRAVLDGLVPYDVVAYFAAYPVAQEFPLLPPTFLVLHAPFQIAAFATAATAMTAISLIGIVALSAWVLRLARYPIRPVIVLVVAGLAILSNGGRNLIFSGQSSLVFIAGAYLAITSVRVAPGSIGVFVALIKPSFGLPVAALLAASGRWRRAVVGSAAAFVVAAVLMVPFIVWSGGIGDLVDTLSDNAAFSAASEWVSLETTTGRVDFAATIAMVTGFVPSGVGEIAIGVALIAIGAGVLWVRRRTVWGGPHRDAAIVLIVLATLLGVYHSFYDLLILLLPVVLLTRSDFAGGSVSRSLRWSLLGLVLFASFNPFRIDQVIAALTDSQRLVRLLGPGLTGLSLLIAFVLTAVVVARLPDPMTGHSVRENID